MDRLACIRLVEKMMRKTIGDSSQVSKFLVAMPGLGLSRQAKKAVISEEQAASAGHEWEFWEKSGHLFPEPVVSLDLAPVTQDQPNC